MTAEATSLEAAPINEIWKADRLDLPVSLAYSPAPAARAFSSSYTMNWMAPWETCRALGAFSFLSVWGGQHGGGLQLLAHIAWAKPEEVQ